MGINLRVGGLQTLWIEKRLGDLRLAPANESMPMGPVIVVHDHNPWFSGLRTQGKVYNRDLHHNAAWLSLDGVDQDGFLNTKGLQIKEGDTIAVEITGEARGRGEGKAVPVKICNKIHQSGHVSDNLVSRIAKQLGWENHKTVDILPHDKAKQQKFDEAEESAGRDYINLEQGSVTIDHTRAGWMIDVNGPDCLETNIAAAQCIGDTIINANLGGLVVIDFIPVADKAGRRTVTNMLCKALAADPLKHEIDTMNHHGILAVHRQSWGRSLIETQASFSYQILATIRQWAFSLREGNRGPFSIGCDPIEKPWVKPLVEDLASQWSVELHWHKTALSTPFVWRHV